jgi:hypothetical protein
MGVVQSIHLDRDTVCLICGGALIVVIFAVLLAVLASRSPLRAIGRGLVRLGLFRGLARKSDIVTMFNASPDFKKDIGRHAFAALARVFRVETATDAALAGIDEDFAREDGRDSGPYDFANKEEKNLARRGLLFQWISVKPSYMSDITHLTSEIADVYFRAAKLFFRIQVPINADIRSLYEDVEGAIAIVMFRVRDRNCYYLLNEMRRTINDNVRKMTILFSSIVSLVLVIGVFFFGVSDHAVWPVQHDFLGIRAEFFNRGVAGFLLCSCGIFLMWLAYYMEYVPNQRNNGRELRGFLSRYMSRLSDRYRDSMANARAVTVGDETDSVKLSAEAQKWHKIMLWLSMRVFFVEGFVRNILFQIGRNSGYYVVFCPLAFIGTILLVANTGASLIPDVSLLQLLAGPGPVFYIMFFLMLLLFTAFLLRAMDPIDDMNQADWLGFDNFNVDKGMDDVVGKYAEDVGYWKGRLDR